METAAATPPLIIEKQILNIGNIADIPKATYKELQNLAKRGKDTWKWKLEDIVVSEGWNNRDMGDIESLALGIWESKGTTAIDVDVLPNGKAVIIDGERRYTSYIWLKNNGYVADWLEYMLVFVADKTMSLTDRKIKRIYANNKKSFEPYEEALNFKELLDGGMSEADIAKFVGTNRMHVNNRIKLSEITTVELEFIKDRIISITEWVKLARAVKDPLRRVNKIIDAQKKVWFFDTDKILAEDAEKQGLPVPSTEAPPVVDETAAATEPETAPGEDRDDDIEIPEVKEGKFVISIRREPNDGDYFVLCNEWPIDGQGVTIEKCKEDAIINLKSYLEMESYTQSFIQAEIAGIEWHLADYLNPDILESESNPSGLTNKTESEPAPNRNEGKGLSALLGNIPGLEQIRSTIPAAEEPELKIKKSGLTAREIISDEVGSTLGDQEPETGNVNETLSAVMVELRMLNRISKSDSKITDITFRIEKKLRHVQGIAKNSLFGHMKGEVTEKPF